MADLGLRLGALEATVERIAALVRLDGRRGPQEAGQSLYRGS